MIIYLILLIVILLILLLVYAIFKLVRQPNKIGIESESLQPLVGEMDETMKCNLYKLEDTSNLQANVKKAIIFDNLSYLVNRDYQDLSDQDIIQKYSIDDKVWQYDDEFGIHDYLIGDELEAGRLPIFARTDDDSYDVVGYIAQDLASDLFNRRNQIDKNRLIYYGGNYKYIVYDGLKATVNDGFEDYVLTLSVCYKGEN